MYIVFKYANDVHLTELQPFTPKLYRSQRSEVGAFFSEAPRTTAIKTMKTCIYLARRFISKRS